MSQPDASTLLKLGISAAKSGNKRLAQQYFLRVIETQPNYESSWLWLAITAGSRTEQEGYLQQALAINPDNTQTKAALAKLQARRKPSPTTSLKPAIEQKRAAPLPMKKTAVPKKTAVAPTPKPKPPIKKVPVAPTPKPKPKRALPTWHCPLCQATFPKSQETCPSCHAILSPVQAKEALSNTAVDRDALSKAICRLKNKPAGRIERSKQLYWIGIAHLNLGQLDTAVTHIQTASTLNKGERSWHDLLMQLQTAQKSIQQKEEPPKEPAAGSILIVDDSLTIRKLVTMTLKPQKYKIEEAVDGMDALTKLNDNTYDLILLDITMPRMDGYQLCKIVKGNKQTKDIPVIMLSGKDGFFDKVRGRMAGATDHISKPFEPNGLVKTVKKYITK